MSGKKIRAVGYCRTSSEAQKDNTSIPNQKAEIERFAALMDWAFGRHYVDESKSGSKVEGRDQFQQMMRDAATGAFDIILVFDIKRYGRDGADIINSSQTLAREFGVHVTDTKGQFDTRDRRRVLGNYVFAGAAEDERLAILERTKNAKIRWARETGAPVAANRPFGRVWRQTGKKASQGVWVIDPDKRAMVADVAARYLAGESLPKMAKEYGANHANLRRVLRDRCGPVWVQHVRCKELGIDEEIETDVPALLDEETIKAVVDRLTANGKHLHKPPRPKHDYLLGGRVFCGLCGYTLIGQTNRHGRRYYRHPHKDRVRVCPVRARFWVPADAIEEQVVDQLFRLYGNPAAIARAVGAAVPDLEEMVTRRDRLRKDLAKVGDKRARVIDLVAEGDVTKTEAKGRLAALATQEAVLRAELDQVESALAAVPEAEAVRCFVERFGDEENPAIAVSEDDGYTFRDANGLASWLEMMADKTGQDRRQLIASVFDAPLANGDPAGVYVTPPDDVRASGPKKYSFALRGRLPFELVAEVKGRKPRSVPCTTP